MSARVPVLTESGNLVHSSPPDLLYTILFSMISLMHASIFVPAFWIGRWEAFMSAGLCVLFAVVAIACRKFRFEVAVLKNEKQIRLRHGIGRFFLERVIPFAAITDVRLTLLGGTGPDGSQIELLSRNDDLRYPPSQHPRQEALLLAMTLGVPLVKVYGENVLPDQERFGVE